MKLPKQKKDNCGDILCRVKIKDYFCNKMRTNVHHNEKQHA